MRALPVLLLALLAVAGCESHRMEGGSDRLSIAEMDWLAAGIRHDFAHAPVGGIARVAAGKVVVRADGEVINCAPLVAAALDGLRRQGVAEAADGAGDAVVAGSITVNAESAGRTAATEYLVTIRLVGADQTVRFTQTWTVLNRSTQERWK